MNLKPKRLPPLIWIGSILGFGLSMGIALQERDDRGLLPDSHPLLVCLLILTAAVMLLLFLGTRNLRNSLSYKKLFPRSVPALVGNILAALGTTAYSIDLLMKPVSGVSIVAGVAGCLAAVVLVFLGLFRSKALRPHYLLHSIVTIFLVLRTIASYQTWNTTPQLQLFLFPLLATVFLPISLYQRAALDGDCGNR
ncbi:MAG: hypothetical protein J6Q54_08975, partial [Oscillospiraceae bacterium]|nr:hypothetical protein [Oscillospiraceae bacterium]